MKVKSLLLSLCVAASAPLSAQTYYDLTDVYVTNPGFDENVAYNDTETPLTVSSGHTVMWNSYPWELRLSGENPIHEFTFKWGADITAGSIALPKLNSDNTDEGGALLFDVGSKQKRAVGQLVTLPPGSYMLVVPGCNITTTMTLANRSGWYSTSSKKSRTVQSTKSNYPTGEWVRDSIYFQVSETVDGYIQVGYGATTVIAAVYPVMLYDGVRLYRTTPLDETDVEVRLTKLQNTITEAETLYGDGDGKNAGSLLEAINTAKGVAESGTTDLGAIASAIESLKQEMSEYEWSNNGIEPVLDTRFARGATMAFGRMTVEGDKNNTVFKQGIVVSQNKDANFYDTEDDIQYSTLSNNGTIYYARNLKPQTKYYMRAYIMDRDMRVKYSEPIKFYTIPMGNITYWYNEGGDAAANARVHAAAKEACNIFNNLASARKHFSIGYSSGTPTADCYYADEPWMNMGANSSYQRTGTIMHEMEHGLGLVPYTTQWNKNILRERLDGSGRGSGYWLGDRVSMFLDFWDNKTGSQLNGDYQHMWPYGINGASEDHGSLVDYYANALICQALGEDGLEHNYSTVAERYYAFEQEDDVKYYLKNEHAERGLYTSYLAESKTGTLILRKMPASEAAANDSCAWYITFEPVSHLYLFRNAATGHYITYNGTRYTMVNRTSPTTADHMQLMRGRVDVTDYAHRGYWIFNPTTDWEPKALYAQSATATGALKFNINNTAATQRWLILTDEEMRQVNTVTDGIVAIEADKTDDNHSTAVYDLLGRRMQRNAETINQLPQGIYIVGGKKVVVK